MTKIYSRLFWKHFRREKNDSNSSSIIYNEKIPLQPGLFNSTKEKWKEMGKKREKKETYFSCSVR